MQYCSQCKNVYPTDMQFCPRHGAPLESRHELVPGMIVREKYEIQEEIGAGGMGRVFRIKDLDFTYGRNQSAMKVPSAILAEDPGFVRRFRDEAAKARVLSHPNVVRIEHIDRTESGTPFLIMELVEGYSLRWWMDRVPPLDWRVAVQIVRETACALEAAHAAGLVHCDIKPENVLSVGKSTPVPLKVTDFGVAKATQALLEKMTRVQPGTSWGSGMVVGTPEYMSPEQTRGRGDVGPPSDVYSLGLVLLELLTGKSPQAGANGNEQGTRQDGGGIPSGLFELARAMMDVLPERRPTATDVVSRLDRQWTAIQAEPGEHSRTVVESRPENSDARTAAQIYGGGKGVRVRAFVKAHARPFFFAALISIGLGRVSGLWRLGGDLGVLSCALTFLIVLIELIYLVLDLKKIRAIPGRWRRLGGTIFVVSSAIAFLNWVINFFRPAPLWGVSLLIGLILLLDRRILARQIGPNGGGGAKGPGSDRPESRRRFFELPPVGPVVAGVMFGVAGVALLNYVLPWAELSYIRNRAEAGDAKSMAELSQMFEWGGDGLPMDDAQATAWTRKAAEAGDGPSMTKLGIMYDLGSRGFSKDESRAVLWFENAAKAGDPDGMELLGEIYEYGSDGLPKDVDQAVAWYRSAAEAGNRDAKKALQRLGR